MYTERGRTLKFCNGPPPQLYTPALALWDCVIYTQQCVWVRVCTIPPPPNSVSALWAIYAACTQMSSSTFPSFPAFSIPQSSVLPIILKLLFAYAYAFTCPLHSYFTYSAFNCPSHSYFPYPLPFLDIWVSSYIAYVFFPFFWRGVGADPRPHIAIWDLEA